MRIRHMPTLLLAFALLLAACGGGDSSDGGGGDGGGSGNGDGELVVGGDLGLPDYFPSDFYVPDSVTIRGVSENPAANTMSLTGRYDGDGDAVRADMVSGLQAAGYELLVDDEDISVFIKDGVGRIRIRAREFLSQPTLTVDIDTWTDEQIAELRDISAEEVVVAGSATATYGGETLEAVGECYLKGPKRQFFAENYEFSLQIDETRDPVYVYADITPPDGRGLTLDESAGADWESSPTRMKASGEMYDYTDESADNIDFTIEVTCAG